MKMENNFFTKNFKIFLIIPAVIIGLALILTPRLGLIGYWIAMLIELNVRGLLLVGRIRGERWMKTKLTTDEI